MKLKNMKSLLALIIVFSLTITSCLKDKMYDNGSVQSVNGPNVPVISTGVSATNSINFLAIGVANSNNDTVMNLIPVVLSTANPAAQDIHVTLVQTDSLLVNYNAANTDTTVTPTNPNPTMKVTHLVPPTKFTVVNPGGVVTIPKGSNTGYLQIKFKPSDYLGGPAYALGFTITSIAEKGYVISGNLNFGIVSINIKNQWDGNYHASGVRVHPSLGPFPFDYNANVSTTSATSIDGKVLADLGEGLSITINPDNTVSLAGDARAVFLTAGGVNKYDPATKTFTLSYYYNSSAPRVITETLVRNP